MPPGGKSERAASLAHLYRVELAPDQAPEEAVQAFQADPHVEYAQMDHAYALDRYNDPFLASRGSWGQDFDDLWGLDRIRAFEGWEISKGEGVVVAVVDTGLDYSHPDIADNVWVNPGEDLDGDGVVGASDWNGLDDDGNGFVDDLRGFDFATGDPDLPTDPDPFDEVGHGTHVSGTIAALLDNGIGIAGVAPHAEVMPLKGFAAGESGLDSTLWRAVLYAAENGAAVVNNSWSCNPACPENPFAEEVLELVEDLGMVVVTSASNRSDDVVFLNPENQSSVITVGALGYDDELALFSNRGWLVDLVAPGGGPSHPTSVRVARRNILSLRSSQLIATEDTFSVGEDYLRWAGTSMAAPHVAGAVALLLAQRPELSPSDVRRLLRLSARDLGDPGHDPIFGAGSLDLVALLETPRPDLELELESPRQGASHDPRDGPLVVRARAAGGDLISVSLAVGEGLEPGQFDPIAEHELPYHGDIEVEWAVDGVPDGPKVLRLRAQLRGGGWTDEHLVVSIERNPSLAISSGSVHGLEPAISGRSVVWDAATAVEEIPSQNIVQGGFGRPGAARRERVVAEAPVWRFRPAISSDVLAWVARDVGRNVLEVCWRRGVCQPLRVAEDIDRILLRGRSLVWVRRIGRERVIEGCHLEQRPGEELRCEVSLLVEPGAGVWSAESFDGETLILRDSARGSQRLALCRVGTFDAPCQPIPIELDTQFSSLATAAHDGDLLGLELARVENQIPPGCEASPGTPECGPEQVVVSRVAACVIDETVPSCALTEIAEMDNFSGLRVSDSRIVWLSTEEGERSAVHFCQFEAETGRCPAQRLGGTLGAQTRPAIDRHRVVWEDARDGIVQVRGLELPRVWARSRIRVRAGRPFVIPVFADPGSAGSVTISVEPVAGMVPDRSRVRIRSRRRGLSRLTGRFAPGAVGTHLWRVIATTDTGLATSKVVELEVRGRAQPR